MSMSGITSSVSQPDVGLMPDGLLPPPMVPFILNDVPRHDQLDTASQAVSYNTATRPTK